VHQPPRGLVGRLAGQQGLWRILLLGLCQRHQAQPLGEHAGQHEGG